MKKLLEMNHKYRLVNFIVIIIHGSCFLLLIFICFDLKLLIFIMKKKKSCILL